MVKITFSNWGVIDKCALEEARSGNYFTTQAAALAAAKAKKGCNIYAAKAEEFGIPDFLPGQLLFVVLPPKNNK